MTAYGRAHKGSKLGNFVVEIQSVNRKFLEIGLNIPSEFARFDQEIKKWICEKVGRGQISVKLSVSYELTMPITIKPNLTLAKQVQNACIELGDELGLESISQLTAQMLIATKGIIHYDEKWEEEEAYLECIHEVIQEAIEKLLIMKKTEGEALAADIQKRLNHMKQGIEKIFLYSPEAVKKQKQKLKERLEEILPGRVENEERLLREICLYAEKVDITEEITRFHSHINQFEQILNSNEVSVGKTIEFLLQELNREVNTVGSKSSDINIAQTVIEIKSELEKIREQIQNVE